MSSQWVAFDWRVLWPVVELAVVCCGIWFAFWCLGVVKSPLPPLPTGKRSGAKGVRKASSAAATLLRVLLSIVWVLAYRGPAKRQGWLFGTVWCSLLVGVASVALEVLTLPVLLGYMALLTAAGAARWQWKRTHRRIKPLPGRRR